MIRIKPQIDKRTYFSGVFAIVVLAMGIGCIGAKAGAESLPTSPEGRWEAIGRYAAETALNLIEKASIKAFKRKYGRNDKRRLRRSKRIHHAGSPGRTGFRDRSQPGEKHADRSQFQFVDAALVCRVRQSIRILRISRTESGRSRENGRRITKFFSGPLFSCSNRTDRCRIPFCTRIRIQLPNSNPGSSEATSSESFQSPMESQPELPNMLYARLKSITTIAPASRPAFSWPNM